MLTPATEGSLGIGVTPGSDGGLAAAITLDTRGLGRFVIPLTAAQVGVLTVVGRRLLDLDEQQAMELRAELVREIEEGATDNE